MSKKLSKKAAFLVAIVAATVAGSVSTAVVMAAIPSGNGTINGCYSRVTGNLRVIDAEDNENCRVLENSLNWNQSGGSSETAVARFNSTGTLDTTYSRGVTAAQIVTYQGTERALCFKVSFDPRIATRNADGAITTGIMSKGALTATQDPASIDSYCGSGAGFNAVDPEASIIDSNPDSQKYMFVK